MSKIIVQSIAAFCLVLFVSTAVSSYTAIDDNRPQEQEPLRSNEDIQKVVRKGLPAIKKCYNDVLEDSPDVEGKITYSITIAPDGQVRKVDIAENTTNSKDLVDCVSRLIYEWRFSSVSEDEDAKITFTLPFSPKK